MPCCSLDNAVASFVQAVRNLSTSTAVVFQPRLTRTAPRCRGPDTPMAASTCEGWTLPEEQAAPDDTATPSRSKAITAVSALMPESANKVVFGNRGAEGGDAGNILRSSTQPPLLATAADQRLGKMDVVAGADQRTGALGAADLMRRQR